jgi:hypothetical protein
VVGSSLGRIGLNLLAGNSEENRNACMVFCGPFMVCWWCVVDVKMRRAAAAFAADSPSLNYPLIVANQI